MKPPSFKHVLFAPWVGGSYESAEIQGRRRLLIMGESHYSWAAAPEDKSTWTQFCVQALVNGTGYERFWPSIERTILGKTPNAAERSRFWNGVAFYNYVQESVGDGPDKKVKWRVLVEARPAFLEILQALKPQTLLVFSRRVWTSMPLEDETGPSISVNGATIETARYNIGNGQWTLAYSLRHPRAGLSPPAWHAALTQALADVK